jgi:hypothetical protein
MSTKPLVLLLESYTSLSVSTVGGLRIVTTCGSPCRRQAVVTQVMISFRVWVGSVFGAFVLLFVIRAYSYVGPVLLASVKNGLGIVPSARQCR